MMPNLPQRPHGRCCGGTSSVPQSGFMSADRRSAPAFTAPEELLGCALFVRSNKGRDARCSAADRPSGAKSNSRVLTPEPRIWTEIVSARVSPPPPARQIKRRKTPMPADRTHRAPEREAPTLRTQHREPQSRYRAVGPPSSPRAAASTRASPRSASQHRA